MKTCATCGQEKPAEAFRRHGSSSGGRRRHCNACLNLADTLRRGLTPTKMVLLNKRWLEAFGLKRCWKCKSAEPLQAFPRNRAQRDGRGTACRGCQTAINLAKPLAERNARVQSWIDRHPERARELGQRAASARRARIRVAFVEHVEPRVLLERDGGVCGICDEPVSDRFDVDHIVPLAAGGEHSYANTRIAHPSCNRAKGRSVALAVA